ncbi:alpha/beta fold hydrolase [Nocardia puris]|uniref:alpha/beta fold hydrolase n=1 Tax=Nocardia puris TaxID=208602 RepID=UPI0018936123|nr:alpha/beta fold hydrolase [Nocardia puris]MBF6212427.1 alpha/beta fold hydrolase [Nocardia puris]MBF6366674.1 alpha/beta fold hydrolase [Nocardia puris]MBF6461016.1 alpha/beta fold hydrolase [Nocardia puris]
MKSDASKSPAARAHRAPAEVARPTRALHLGSGDPLLLLHPFMLSPHVWERTAARLASHCEVYAPALPGHWGGAPLTGRTTDPHALADAIERQLDEMGWRTCHIAGNSLGGWIGVELARRGRARTLTLIAPAGGWHCPSFAQFRIGAKFLSLVPAVELGKRLGSFATDNPAVRRLVLFLLNKNASAVPRHEAATTIRAALHCQAMLPLIVGGLFADAMPDLSTLTTPVRLLLAETDRIIPNRVYARRYLRELPDSADRILVNGVGHVPMLEAPDRIATLIAEHVYASRTRLRAV